MANAALVVPSKNYVNIDCSVVSTPPSCILDGAGTNQILFLNTTANVSLSGLTLQNGYTAGHKIPTATGHNSINGGGGAVFVSPGATLTANGDTFAHNTATALGGAIFEGGSATVHVEGATFTGNSAPTTLSNSHGGTVSNGGAIFDYSGATEGPVGTVLDDANAIFSGNFPNDVMNTPMFG